MKNAKTLITEAGIDTDKKWYLSATEFFYLDGDTNKPMNVTKDAYLAWVAEWKAQYKILSQTIRKIKEMRPMNDHRISNEKADRRRVVVGVNPQFDPAAAMEARHLKALAYVMLVARAYAKKEAKMLSEINRLCAA